MSNNFYISLTGYSMYEYTYKISLLFLYKHNNCVLSNSDIKINYSYYYVKFYK